MALECCRQASRSLNFTQLSRIGTHNKTNIMLLLFLKFLVKLPGRTEYLFGERGYRRQRSAEGMVAQSMVLCELQNLLSHLLCNPGQELDRQGGERVPSTGTSDNH